MLNSYDLFTGVLNTKGSVLHQLIDRSGGGRQGLIRTDDIPVHHDPRQAESLQIDKQPGVPYCSTVAFAGGHHVDNRTFWYFHR